MTELLLRRGALYDGSNEAIAYQVLHSAHEAAGLAALLDGNRAKALARGLPLFAVVATDELDAVLAACSDVQLWIRPAETLLDDVAINAWSTLPEHVDLVIGDPTAFPGHAPLADRAAAVHLDVEHLDVNEVTSRRQGLGAGRLIVTGVNRADLAVRVRKLGATLVGGLFLNDVSHDLTRVVAGDRLTLLQLMAHLQSPSVSPRQVTQLVEQSPGVSFELLRWVNSAYVGLKHPVDQIGRAVGLLGPGRVRQVVSLLLTRELSDRPSELSRTALLRGRMCEQIAEALDDARPAYYVAGMFSMLDALLESPLEQLITQLPLTDEVVDALLHHEGTVGRVLQATKLYDHANFDDPILDMFDPSMLAAAYLDALVFADDVLGATPAA